MLKSVHVNDKIGPQIELIFGLRLIDSGQILVPTIITARTVSKRMKSMNVIEHH